MRRTRISINIQESVLNVAGEKFEASGGKKVGNRQVAIFRACIWFTWLHWDTLKIINWVSLIEKTFHTSKNVEKDIWEFASVPLFQLQALWR